jgi:AbrB family looped-hinge helix DNA binding protein
MSTTVTVKGQVTLPKAVREQAGIRPGNRVTVCVRPEGGVIVEREKPSGRQGEYRRKLEDIARRRPLGGGPFEELTTDQIMDLLRGDDRLSSIPIS